jgi:hypothetical protein
MNAWTVIVADAIHVGGIVYLTLYFLRTLRRPVPDDAGVGP